MNLRWKRGFSGNARRRNNQLPNYLQPLVQAECAIGRDDGDIFLQGLCDQLAVKRIPVVLWQRKQPPRVMGTEGYDPCEKVLGTLKHERRIECQFADSRLDGDFNDGDRTHLTDVGGVIHGVLRAPREEFRRLNRPDQHDRIQQEPQSAAPHKGIGFFIGHRFPPVRIMNDDLPAHGAEPRLLRRRHCGWNQIGYGHTASAYRDLFALLYRAKE